jgi:hypothetical protein
MWSKKANWSVMACSAACEVNTKLGQAQPTRDAPASRRSHMSVLTSLSGQGSCNSTKPSSLWKCLAPLQIQDTELLQISHTYQSNWRPISGTRRPLILRLPPHRLRPCPNPPQRLASRHSSASIKLHYEVCPRPYICASSLTNQPADRLPADIAWHYRRLDNAESQRPTDACATRLRSNFHICTTIVATGEDPTPRAMR